MVQLVFVIVPFNLLVISVPKNSNPENFTLNIVPCTLRKSLVEKFRTLKPPSNKKVFFVIQNATVNLFFIISWDKQGL